MDDSLGQGDELHRQWQQFLVWVRKDKMLYRMVCKRRQHNQLLHGVHYHPPELFQHPFQHCLFTHSCKQCQAAGREQELIKFKVQWKVQYAMKKELHMEDSVPYPKHLLITIALVKIFPFLKHRMCAHPWSSSTRNTKTTKWMIDTSDLNNFCLLTWGLLKVSLCDRRFGIIHMI